MATTSSVRRQFGYVLRNVVYTGKVHCNGETYAGEHEPIVDEAVWHRAQSTLRCNRRGSPRPLWNKHGMLLKGLLHCQICGSPMKHRILDPAGRRLYYVCARVGPRGAMCPAGYVRARELEAALLNHMRRQAAERPRTATALRELREEAMERAAELEQRRHSLNEALQRPQEQTRQLPEAPGGPCREQGKTAAQRAAVRARTEGPEQRVKSVRAELVSSHRELIDERRLVQALSIFGPRWDSLEPLEQWRALRILIARIGYDARTGKVRVWYQGPGIRALCRRSSQFGFEPAILPL